MAKTNLQRYRFAISGMTCAACAARIEKVLARDPHNQRVAVNFSAKSAAVDSDLPAAALIAAVAKLGYQAVERPDVKRLAAMEAAQLAAARRQLLLALALSLPVLVLGMAELDAAWSAWVQLVLTAMVLAGPGRGFYSRAVQQLRHGTTSMDTLISLGTAAAFGISCYLLATGMHHLYFESAAVIIALILVGKYLEERARLAIAASVRALLTLQPAEATRLPTADTPADQGERVPVMAIELGAFILVRPGDRFAVDGIVARGASSVDASMLTGESLPVDIGVGAAVAAGTQNIASPVVIQATGVGDDTELGRIVAMVETAQGTKAPVQALADRIAAWFVPATLAVALLTLVVWLLLGAEISQALTAAVSVLVVACPCALGLATPVALMAATGQAARQGILVKDAAALQTLHRVTAMVFDKTGTLTTGKPEVVEFKLLAAGDASLPAADQVLAWAKWMESGSSHPLAQAIVRYAAAHLGQAESGVSPLTKSIETAGFGVEAELGATASGGPRRLQLGKLAAFAAAPGYAAYQAAGGDGIGLSQVGLAADGHLLAVFGLRDQLRPDAAASLQSLRAAGIHTVMATGDGEAAAVAVAREVGGLEARWSQTPADKAELVQSLRSAGHVVAMAGDGINDAPALAAADVGLAMGSGTDAAMAAAGITLKDSSIAKVAAAVRLSRLTFRAIKQNLFWAFAYNVLLIPAAALGRLSPMLAGGAMAMSSLFVVGNALRLKRGLGP